MMISQNQNSTPAQSLGPPKKFLKKGEGLKRFAAYKPPLPLSTNKVQRRQTFVKFKFDTENGTNRSLFKHPDILFNDSANLSTEIPKIAPPKIMHTPIKPNRQALGVLEPSNDVEPKRYNLRGSKKQIIGDVTRAVSKETRRPRRQVKAVVERHIESSDTPVNREESVEVSPVISESQINGNLDNLLRKIEEKKTILDKERIDDQVYEVEDENAGVQCDIPPARGLDQRPKINPSFDLSNPMPGSCILALGQQIQQIQSTVNELKDKIKNCECGLMASPKSTTKPTTRKASRTKASDKIRPSAYADNSTPRIVRILTDEVSQLRSRFDEMNLRR